VLATAWNKAHRWLWFGWVTAAVAFVVTAEASTPAAGVAVRPPVQTPVVHAATRSNGVAKPRLPQANIAASRIPVPAPIPAAIPAGAFKGAVAGTPPSNPAANAAASASAAAAAALDDPCATRYIEATAPPVPEVQVQSPDEALDRLITGNDRFMDNRPQGINRSYFRRTDVAQAQAPFAIIFSCTDSRVPPEIIFDRGLGDLLVVRTAGHVVDNATLGSIEFGTEELHIPLIVVLGHERCGAVKATMDFIAGGGQAPDQISAIVNGVRPATLKAFGAKGDALDATVKANVQLTVTRLRRVPLLADAIAKGRLKIVGARYDLDTGGVEVIVP
jgi:carbonic anhydrase